MEAQFQSCVGRQLGSSFIISLPLWDPFHICNGTLINKSGFYSIWQTLAGLAGGPNLESSISGASTDCIYSWRKQRTVVQGIKDPRLCFRKEGFMSIHGPAEPWAAVDVASASVGRGRHEQRHNYTRSVAVAVTLRRAVRKLPSVPTGSWLELPLVAAEWRPLKLTCANECPNQIPIFSSFKSNKQQQ